MKNRFDETASLLLLIRHAGNAASLRVLLENFDGSARIVAAGKNAWRAAGVSDKAVGRLLSPDLDRLEKDLAWCAQPGNHVIAWHSPDYPALLKQADNPPPAIFVSGDVDLLWHPQIAIVGSRHPSAGGRDNACEFSRALCQAGWCVTSGLAEGIDTSAHTGALAARNAGGKGKTIAVVATGLDLVYPERNTFLKQAISQYGAVVTEHPPGTPALKEHFPSRNRLIAALSLGCLVIEAAERSGALITARLAGEIGREVFALPGSIHNPMARGCHKLIRQGATLIEKPEQVISALGPVAIQLAQALRGRLERSEAIVGHDRSIPVKTPHKPVWNALGHDLTSIDQLAERTGLTTPELSSMLLLMELEGSITVSDGRYARNT